jgi:hypothetical protein
MLKLLLSVVSVAGIMLLTACAPQTRYSWNKYDSTLYNHYKDPSQVEQFNEALQEIVVEAEADQKVPPGIYAEYGYFLYEQGCNTEAIQYFQKESNKWPESRTLMAKMISNAQDRFNKQGDKAKPAPIKKIDDNSLSLERYR